MCSLCETTSQPHSVLHTSAAICLLGAKLPEDGVLQAKVGLE